VVGVVTAGSPTTVPPTRPAIVAHRGGARLWPENSLTAFRGALELGVDLVELDVHQTRDWEVVVLHDPTLDRTTTGRGVVADLTWPELAGITIRGTPAERLPRLGDVLALLRHSTAGLLLEIKTGPGGTRYRGIEERVLAELEAAGLTARTTVMAFDWTIMARMRELSRSLRRTALLAREGAERLGGVAPAADRAQALGADDLGLERTLLTPAATVAGGGGGRPRRGGARLARRASPSASGR
jgi:glycerophosphoryl diester phosphodiesterase